MAALEEKEIIEQLKTAGTRLQEMASSSRDELLKLLEDLEIVLSKVDQAPSRTIQEALLPAMKALISDVIRNNSDSDIKITVAVCFNEIMRITAPDSPYDDSRMKEIFELIVGSFDKLSLLSGNSYSKALSIIDNVAKVKSCVMMLDIECDKLIIEMFEQFKRNIRSDHPPSVFMAMEDIMSHIIDESEDIPLDLLKVLLDCVCKEKENTSPMSWRLGAKVMERTSKKLKPYLRGAIESGDVRKDDYAPLIDSILQVDSKMVEQKHVADSTKQLVAQDSPVDASCAGDVSKSGDAALKPDLNVGTILGDQGMTVKEQPSNSSSEQYEQGKASIIKPVLNLDANFRDQGTAFNEKPSKTPVHFKSNKASDNTDTMRAEGRKENERSFPIKGQETSSKKPLISPRGRPKKNSTIAVKTDSTLKDVPCKVHEVLTSPEEKKHQDLSVKSSHRSKKVGRPKKDAVGGSGNKGSSLNQGMDSSSKEKNGMDESEKKVLRRKRDQMEDEVFETPFGKKKYKEDIVGCRLKVWWPKDKTYYEGRVSTYNHLTKKHRVDYIDGDVEHLNLVNEQFEFIGDEIAVFDRNVDVKPHPSSDERSKQDHSAKRSETQKITPKDDGKPHISSDEHISSKQDHSAKKTPKITSKASIHVKPHLSSDERPNLDHSSKNRETEKISSMDDVKPPHLSSDDRSTQDHSAKDSTPKITT